MNGYHNERELPVLDDDQIRLLDTICKVASRSTEPPFRALTREYGAQFEEKGLETSHDDVILRWIMRVGESARHSYRVNRPTNFIPYLRGLLESQGITVIDDEDEGQIEGVTRSLEVEPASALAHLDSERKRRVSFDDAHLEETWLSERSQFVDDTSEGISRDFLRQPPRRAGLFASTPRARSASSSEQRFGGPHPAPKHFQKASQSSDYTSDYEDECKHDQTLYMEPSQTQLEQNAEAFRDTTLLQHQRTCLRILHNATLDRQRDYTVASARDRAQLLKPTFYGMHNILLARRQEQDHQAHLERKLVEVQNRKNLNTLGRAFAEWYRAVLYHREAINLVRRILISQKYFRIWRETTEENIVKSRSILLRKYLRIWQLKTVRKSLEDEMRVAQYEEILMRKYLKKWRLNCRSSGAEPVHEAKVERRVLVDWLDTLQRHRANEEQAAHFRSGRVAWMAFQKLSTTVHTRRQASQTAQEYADRKTASRCIQVLRVEAKLKPLAASLSLKVDLDLKRKTIRVWQLRLELSRQAAEVDRKRILQSAWTNWNDALRCKALGQKIDERVLLESLSKWVLQTRLKSFQRRQNQKLLQRTVATWRASVEQKVVSLERASEAFTESQRRRHLKYGIVRLNVAVRQREDAIRSAVEFSNSRALPDVINVWRQRTNHVRQITAWAKDASFYYLSTNTLKVWQERVTQHQHERRRQAYAQVRARVKIRIVRQCFDRLQAKSANIATMQHDAQRRYETRLFRVGTECFDIWRQKTAQRIELYFQATAADQQKLLTSALSALVDQHADTAALQQQALLLRQDSDLTLQASALKKFQWATFTANRRVESADALWARNRDLHVKQMLRHWASKAIKQRSDKSKAARQDPESPSLRLASRLASRSAERTTFASSPSIQSTTPGYMRTPSRSRRAGRFRPLPTPAHVTPMDFDKSYFITTPAPLANAEAREDVVNEGDESNVFDGVTPQITPFARKLRAGGVTPAPPSALRSSIFGRSLAAGGTSKSVRFAGSSRFGSSQRRQKPTDQ